MTKPAGRIIGTQNFQSIRTCWRTMKMWDDSKNILLDFTPDLL